LWDNGIYVEPSRSTFSKFVRYVVYPSEIFKRNS